MNCQMHGKIATRLEFYMPCRSLVMRILKDRSGASAMEYGLILAMISISLIFSMQGLSTALNAVWSNAMSSANAVFGTSS